MPAGFTPLGEDKAFRGAPFKLPLAHEALKRRALSPGAGHLLLRGAGLVEPHAAPVGYVMRAAVPRARSPRRRPTVEDMYAPRVHGRGSPAVLEVVASAASR